jgi:hypothetical protein
MNKATIMAGALALAATPADAQENPPNLFDSKGAYNMHVACPLWEVPLNEDPDRLLICMQALAISLQAVEWENSKLRERLDRLEELQQAIGVDLSRLYNWSHCHGGQTECAALRDREWSMEPKYPDITVYLTGQDANAFNVLGLVKRELKRAGVDQAEIDEFMTEARQGTTTTCCRPSYVGSRSE